MTSPREPDRLIRAFLDEGMAELPDRAYDEVRAEIENTRQRFVFGPWREQQMTRFATLGIAAAAIVIAVVIGIRFIPGNNGVGVGGQPTPTPAPPSPTLTPSVSPTAPAVVVEDPEAESLLEPGISYVAHPFDSILSGDARAFTFEVPSANWSAHGGENRMTGMAYHDEDIGGVAVGFLKVDSLNSDACHWTTDEDVEVGPTAANLRTALENSDQFEWDDPVMEAVPGETTAIEITMPATLEEDDVSCDETDYRIWNAEGLDIYAQGPSNLWQVSIFDVDGERYLVIASSMPDTPEEVLTEQWSILRSVRIDQQPGCSQYSHLCN